MKKKNIFVLPQESLCCPFCKMNVKQKKVILFLLHFVNHPEARMEATTKHHTTFNVRNFVARFFTLHFIVTSFFVFILLFVKKKQERKC